MSVTVPVCVGVCYLLSIVECVVFIVADGVEVTAYDTLYLLARYVEGVTGNLVLRVRSSSVVMLLDVIVNTLIGIHEQKQYEKAVNAP